MQAWFALAGRGDEAFRSSRVPMISTNVPICVKAWGSFAAAALPDMPMQQRAYTYYFDTSDNVTKLKKHWSEWYVRSISAYAHAGLDWAIFQGNGCRVWHRIEASATGRLSTPSIGSDFIDAQNLEKAQRQGLRARLGCHFIHADYTAAEICVLAALSGDTALRDAVSDQTVDFFAAMSQQILNNDTMRSKVKACIIMFIYGASPSRIAELTQLDTQSVNSVVMHFVKQFKTATMWTIEQRRIATENGRVTTPIGRIILTPEAYKAPNAVLQSVAADWHRVAFTMLQESLAQTIGEQARVMVHQHDAFLMQVPLHEVTRAGTIAKQVLSIDSLKVVNEAFGLPSDALRSHVKLTICGDRWR